MKHTLGLVLAIVAIFFVTQIIGLYTLTFYVDIQKTAETGRTEIYSDRYIIEPPTTDDTFSFAYIMLGILIGTALALLLLRFKKLMLWKFWFFISVAICLSLGLWPYINILLDYFGVGNSQLVSISTVIFSALLAFLKITKPNVLIHNLTEVFIYTGIAVLLVPVLNMVSVVLLLALVSLYDMWAVWKTRHMVNLAKYQVSANTFAGLRIPYSSFKLQTAHLDTTQKPSERGEKQAILGGGDIAFPLLFSGVVLKLTASFTAAVTVSGFAAISLLLLFVFAKKQNFYPAMPFISLGCLLGWLVAWWL